MAAGTPWRLFDGYQPVAGAYDEMMAPTGGLRPHCEKFVQALETLGRRDLAARWENAKRAIRENGVTYNVYGDPQGLDRPWELDMMPELIPSAEWSRLETALIQRAQLFNLVLADIYGPQKLVREGLLPPALVFGNPAFLRPCHGIRMPENIHLHLQAVDLTRAPDGQWWVLADRTQSPSGAGYALENRIVLSRTLPEAFRDCQVKRLASYFRSFRETLMRLSPKRASNPKVVLLTPGPYNETYFEHAYLARYLGFTLVEGGDLTVRDSRVFIKTLEGLQPVDVVLRRLDDSFCDPLELRSDSFLGVAGLVEAARAGNVTIANSLGSGVTETPAILAFLPGLCKHLLGEELRMPSVATWWCGQPVELKYALDHLDKLVMKRAFPSDSGDPMFGRTLDETEKASLVADIRARPHEYVGQEQVALSTAPVWVGGKLESRPIVVRAYVAAAGDSYVVMPGGLTRVSRSPDVPVVSMQSGGGSKDTWVLSDTPVVPVSLLAPPGTPIRLDRAATDLPSRVADNLFWLGRYAERAEGSMRLLRSIVVRLTDGNMTDDSPSLTALLEIMVGLGLLPKKYQQRVPLRDLENEILALVFKQQRQGSLRQTLNSLRRIAIIVRDRLSIDTWRILNQLHQDLSVRQGRVQLTEALAHLNRTIVDLAAFSGMEMENMTRGHGWRFLDIGRRLERSINLTHLLRAALGATAPEIAVLEPLLEIADSSMTYRRRYFTQPQLAPVLDLLLTDDTNPRSLLFQLAALTDHMKNLPRDAKAPSPTREERLISQTTAYLRQADMNAFCAATGEGRADHVTALLTSIEGDLRVLSDTLGHYYFSHAEPRVR